MRIFRDPAEALKSAQEKRVYYLNSFCPYREERSLNSLCGSWCSKFHINTGIGQNTSPSVILGCKAGTGTTLYGEIV